MRSRAYGPNWPRCAPIWRFCSTPTCRTGLRSKPIGARPAPTANGRPARNPRVGSPPAGSTPRTARTSRRTPRKARSSTCLPNRIRPRPTGCRNRVTAVCTADRRRQSRRGCEIAWRSRRARGQHRQRHRSPRLSRSRSPHPSPNSLGSHRNRSAHPPRRPNRHRRRPRAGAAEPQRRRPRVGAGRADAAAPRAGAGRADVAAPRAGAGRADVADPRAGAGRADVAGPRAGAGRADAAGLAACARRGRVDTRGRTGQQLGVPCRARFVGSADGRVRVRRRICRQEAGTRADDAVSARRPPPRAPLSSAGRRRSWTPAGATDVGRRIRGSPATPRARAGARTATCAAGGAATPQRRGHRRAVGCRAAGQASGHPDRRRPSQAPRRVS